MTKAEIDALGHSIAYDSACTMIESSCPPGLDEGVGAWFNTAKQAVDPDAYDSVVDSVRYLEARGLVKHRRGDSYWIKLLDESEAKDADQ